MKTLLCACVLLCASPTFAADEPATFYSDLTPAAFTPTDGPLTNAMNLRVRTDENGYLLATVGTYGSTDGPLTSFGNLRLRTDSNGYLLVALPAGAGAPTDATYITKTANSTLSAEFPMASLPTGIVKNTTTTGTPSIAAAGTDYQAPITCADTGVVFASGANTLGCNAALTFSVGQARLGIFDASNGESFGITTLAEGAIFTIGAAASAMSAGTSVIVQSGRDSATKNPGDVTIQVPDSTHSSRGGSVYYVAGAGDSGVGGSHTFTAGNAAGASTAGNFIWNAGSSASGTQGLFRWTAFYASGTSESLELTATASNTMAVSSSTGVTSLVLSGIGMTASSVTSRLVANGSAPAVANVAANSCGTSAASIAGNDNTGEITVGATAGTQCRITFTVAASVRYNCTCSDSTTAALCRSTFVDTTHSDIFGAFTAGDVVEYICLPR